MRQIFGTDGVRGVANVPPMTVDTALKIGRSVAHLFRNSRHRHRRILIGKDTRLSGYMLENALAAGICSMGVDVFLVGPMPTPAIAFLTTNMRADAGVVISASHNPFQDNGIKIFAGNGFKLPDEVEARIEALMESDEPLRAQPTGADVGKAFRIDDARGRYIVFLKHTFPKDLTLEGLRLVLDCANGATYRVAPAVLEELGASVIALGVSPNGTNINQDCGALHPEPLREAVLRHRAHMGIALDGDGDRVIVVDEKGRIVDGDHIMAVCARDLLEAGRLAHRTVVATVMSNMGLEIALERMGARLIRTQVGDRYVVETMRAEGYNFGGEQSGHLVFLDHITTGDGILAALQLLAVMQRTGRPLSELAAVMETFPQVLHNVRLAARRPIDQIEGLEALRQRLQRELAGKGRILIRASGTEPVIRVMVEGEDEGRIADMAQAMGDHIRSVCGGAEGA
ncbi:phosphoglucosamine mutase [Dissulfurirhabdus thermomarina]|uniref:Phosphoglucosamine mutase n=1 Tax=Dissulfurirhabdus thermomarina TaxID=1765737 RepID=A0A6N9TP58_DISTH|nr:phosphoglucosamine mutase [Dissulfurirhabdus thermomarina]NDY42838.1 phosphoglucosamine mutase [Dissulfurirhabdus thermomarina]NMX24235.1 phosphoglucosamine mutase [Dissulfurirhabdus thermomarina]